MPHPQYGGAGPYGEPLPEGHRRGLGAGEEAFFYKQTYYSAEDFSDSRYDPFFAPLVYPGQTLHLSVLPQPCGNLDAFARLYAKTAPPEKCSAGKRSRRMDSGMSWPSPFPQARKYIQEVGVILCGTSSGFGQRGSVRVPG